jgi:hypothetical protein
MGGCPAYTELLGNLLFRNFFPTPNFAGQDQAFDIIVDLVRQTVALNLINCSVGSHFQSQRSANASSISHRSVHSRESVGRCSMSAVMMVPAGTSRVSRLSPIM